MTCGKCIIPFQTLQILASAGRILGALFLLGGLIGCAALRERPSDALRWPGLGEDYREYAEFVFRNMAFLDQRYSDDYETKAFVVDLPGGSTPIQRLVRPGEVRLLIEKIGLDHLSGPERAEKIFRHLTGTIAFVSEPMDWSPPADTVAAGRGDCKNLSLVLLSLFLAADLQARGAISNGHMWVEAHLAGRWRVFEPDRDPKRGRIYAMDGFYDKPLYRVYADRAEKRRPLGIARDGESCRGSNAGDTPRASPEP